MTDVSTAAPEAAQEVFTPIDLDAPDAEQQLEKAAEQESSAPSGEQDTAPATEQPSGETAEAEPAEEPPIEPPKFWKADAKAKFAELPRELQQYVAAREQERDTDFRRRQNEAADKLKGLSAKEAAVEALRQQYETTLPQLLQVFQSQQAGEFADIKTIQDVEKLAREDWPRYLQWDVAQKKIAATQQEVIGLQQRQLQERAQKFAEFAKSEDSLFSEKVPDMADAEKAAQLQQRAISVLQDLGFDDEELAKSWNGEKDISLRDHRMQLLISDATLWRDAQAKAAAVKAKPVPKPQSAGTGNPSAGVSDLARVADKGDMEAYIALRAKGAKR